jgi:hypothetical protein
MTITEPIALLERRKAKHGEVDVLVTGRNNAHD